MDMRVRGRMLVMWKVKEEDSYRGVTDGVSIIKIYNVLVEYGSVMGKWRWLSW